MRPANTTIPELATLRARLKAAGLFEYREGRTWLKLAVLLTGVFVGLYAMYRFGPWAAVAAIPVAAVCATSVAMLGHEGSHRSFSSSPLRNNIVNYFAFPLFSGLSTTYWRNKHDRLHHGHPNVEGVDPDIRPWPFASSKAEHARSGPFARFVQRHTQRWAFWPASLLMSLGMRRASLIYVAQYPKQHGIDRAWLMEVACLAAHYALWLVVPSLVFGPLVGFLVYSAIWALVGSMLALVFLPAHVGLPIVHEQHKDWLHQLETTQNLELPKVISYFFIGLDYQVEHHLFPKIPHMNQPAAAKLTAAWCAEVGIVHHSLPYLSALRGASKFMAKAWSTYAAEDPIEVRAGLVSRLVGQRDLAA